MGCPLASLTSSALSNTNEVTGRRDAFPSPKSKTNLSFTRVGACITTCQRDLLGGVMVVRLDPLEFDVDIVLRIERASQDLVWLDLL